MTQRMPPHSEACPVACRSLRSAVQPQLVGSKEAWGGGTPRRRRGRHAEGAMAADPDVNAVRLDQGLNPRPDRALWRRSNGLRPARHELPRPPLRDDGQLLVKSGPLVIPTWRCQAKSRRLLQLLVAREPPFCFRPDHVIEAPKRTLATRRKADRTRRPLLGENGMFIPPLLRGIMPT